MISALAVSLVFLRTLLLVGAGLDQSVQVLGVRFEEEIPRESEVFSFHI